MLPLAKTVCWDEKSCGCLVFNKMKMCIHLIFVSQNIKLIQLPGMPLPRSAFRHPRAGRASGNRGRRGGRTQNGQGVAQPGDLNTRGRRNIGGRQFIPVLTADAEAAIHELEAVAAAAALVQPNVAIQHAATLLDPQMVLEYLANRVNHAHALPVLHDQPLMPAQGDDENQLEI